MYKRYCELRDKAGVKDGAVAKATGITRSTFTDWKNGRSAPKADKMKKIADYFGVSVDYLTGDDNVPNSGQDGYYANPETAKIAQEIFETPGYRILFDAARDSKPEDLQMAADLLRRLKGENSNDPC